ncbi:uncharacterized protein LOC6540794 [Drosophila erecta]|uniref:Uncharacterized protein n=1 Tax=Drosophila erecta TaxID=7220 RepID=B3NAU4_DROER|nr:uncharacterized protein LOC6540794 [Drosophila erecta]EDV58658.1 uncharacterized protein Dere_GG23866 [Drosophila erecta]
MDNHKDKDDAEERLSLPESHQVIINMPSADEHGHVVYLPDANLGATETDASVKLDLKEQLPSADRIENNRVTFELDDVASTSAQSAVLNAQGQKSSEDQGLQTKTEIPNKAGAPKQLHNVLELICRFSNDMDARESRVAPHPAVILQIPQYCELGTQTAEMPSQSRRLRFDPTNLRPDPNRPPCERTQHTFTISGNNMPGNPPQLRQTICARIGRSICDFVAALCLCLQVNKDCIFCLGFFVAFVISASFLTAFFYRTLSFSSSPVRVAASPVSGTMRYELATLRFNGGYYYIYTGNQQKFL